MLNQTIPIKVNGGEAKLYTYLLDNSKEIDIYRERPLALMCPGGGYGFTSDREAEAVAIQYLARGFHACVLRYSVAPAEFPQALCELAISVAHIREHAKEYHVNKDKIVIVGFSAGGHLAASLGVFWDKEWLSKETGLSCEDIRPNGLILSYPVITSGTKTHGGSITNLMGKKESPELKELLSLENQVTANVPPTFIWHTLTDSAVPVQNSLLFAEALINNKVSVELHIFPTGEHGLALANEETAAKGTSSGINKRCEDWMELSCDWLQQLEQIDMAE